MTSGGAGAWCSRGSREAMPNPVSHTPPLAASTRIFAGLMSLWIRPRSCTWRSAPARGIAMRRKWDYVQWFAKQSIERRAAGILEHQRHAVVVVRQRDWSRRPVSIKFGFERIFVFEPLDATERGFFRGNKQDRRQAVAGASVESDVSLPQRREYVTRELLHEDLLPGGL